MSDRYKDLGDFMNKLLIVMITSILAACSSVEQQKQIDNHSLALSNTGISSGQDFLSFYRDNTALAKANIYTINAVFLMFDNLRRKYFDECRYRNYD